MFFGIVLARLSYGTVKAGVAELLAAGREHGSGGGGGDAAAVVHGRCVLGAGTVKGEEEFLFIYTQRS